MKQTLSRIRSPWRRLAITLLLDTLVWLSKWSRRRAHWVGHPRRSKSGLLIIPAIFGTAILLLEPREILVWSAVWGGVIAMLVSAHTFYRILRAGLEI